ncbi:putative aminopeptidase [Tamilnaduibacter salinus]|uniref:Putative aminopeptidase n=1 Tax=Tamilnaduibacter salinus TaxID=1484056 RepID=A0A2U1CWM6_9GAMM|nr:putative aminopeptidase [Tamilnaduibacter salinus]
MIQDTEPIPVTAGTTSVKRSPIPLFVLLIPLLAGCQTLGYYHQAAVGQMTLLWDREPVSEWLDRESTSDTLRGKLQTAMAARAFARTDLSLPVGDTFLDYVAFERSHVVYNLVVAPPDGLAPKQWCYPVVGCQSYRGYFDLADARRERARYQADGQDTFIGGVTAYSTLGWFDDPLHTGFTRLEPHRMVALMFHELAHRVLYIDGDTQFNESFATAVELEGLKRWLQRDGGDPALFQQTLEHERRHRETLALIEHTAERLQALYDRKDSLERDTLRARKTALFDALRADYRTLEADWDEPGPLHYLLDDLNNAVIGLFRQYNADVPAFRQLLADQNGDFSAFYDAVRALGKQPPEQRRAALDLLAKRFDEDL